VPRLRRRPVFGFFFREYSRYCPDLSLRIISAPLRCCNRDRGPAQRQDFVGLDRRRNGRMERHRRTAGAGHVSGDTETPQCYPCKISTIVTSSVQNQSLFGGKCGQYLPNWHKVLDTSHHSFYTRLVKHHCLDQPVTEWGQSRFMISRDPRSYTRSVAGSRWLGQSHSVLNWAECSSGTVAARCRRN
jgi:hypothetical protein